MDIINRPLLSHPINWVLIWVILALGGYALAVVGEGLSALPFPAKA
jgi:hypothetical protein